MFKKLEKNYTILLQTYIAKYFQQAEAPSLLKSTKTIQQLEYKRGYELGSSLTRDFTHLLAVRAS